MRLRIKDGVDLNELRKFGFRTGAELSEDEDFEEFLSGCSYMNDWWIKYQMNPDFPDKVKVTEDENPVCEAWVDTREGKNYLWFDVTPDCTYHASMDELELITETVFDLAMAGLIEKINEEE